MSGLQDAAASQHHCTILVPSSSTIKDRNRTEGDHARYRDSVRRLM